jgi:hypothetical protein
VCLVNSCLYEGHVEHTRLAAPGGRFRHSTYIWYLDLDEVEGLGRSLRLLGVDRPGVYGIRSRDHLGDPARTIRDNVVSYLAEQGVLEPPGRITLLTNARVFGHVFNPLSVFYCHWDDDSLVRVVAEVSNTHGEQHRYLVEPDAHGRCQAPKTFYVSPFLAVEGTYALSFPEPGEDLAVGIELEQQGRPAFAARLTGRRLPLSDRVLLWMLVRHPLMTWQVSALIRRHGIGLWRRGVKVVPHGRPAVGERAR